MNAHQQILLDMLQAVDTVCRQQKITYVMLGGTMLGAYRHNGFIPWDDDVDIGMPRADYERFLRLAGESGLLPPPYILRHFSVERNVPYAFAHVEHTGTTYVERRRSGAGYVGGVYLEIFPLDAAPENLFLQRYRELQVKTWKKWLYAQIMERGKEGRNPLKRLAILSARRFGSIDKTVRTLDKILQRDSQRMPKQMAGSQHKNRVLGKKKDAAESPGQKVPSASLNGKNAAACFGNLLGHWGRKENIPADVLFPPKEYGFEGKRFLGVNRPEQYLTSLYGTDYMTPPPPAMRKDGQHEALVCDLQRPYKK